MTKQIKNKTIDFNFIAMFFVVMIATTISFTSIIFLIGGTINKWLFVLTYLLSIFLTYFSRVLLKNVSTAFSIYIWLLVLPAI